MGAIARLRFMGRTWGEVDGQPVKRAYLGPQLRHGEDESPPQRTDGREDPCRPRAVVEDGEEYVAEEVVGETFNGGDVRFCERDLVLEGGEVPLEPGSLGVTDQRFLLRRLVGSSAEPTGTKTVSPPYSAAMRQTC